MALLYYIIDLSYFQESISIFSGLFFCKNNTFIFTFFVFTLTVIILLLTSFFPRKILNYTFNAKAINKNDSIVSNEINYESDAKATTFAKDENTNLQYINKTAEQYKIIEYPLIILFIISGGIFLMSSSDLISIFLAIELQSYGLYLLCSIYRNSELATNAGLTYFLLGGLSSCIILLGQGLLYIYSGNTYLDGIYIIHSIFESTQSNQIDTVHSLNNIQVEQYTLQLAMIVFTTGFLFKISAAPFHFWSPDVYDAIPTIVTTFVAIIAKITILVFFVELIYYTSTTSYTYTWKNNLLLSSFLSLIIGSVLGLHQVRIKRLLAYSTISHIGFLLLALSINSIESIQAFYFYLIQYSITNLNAFFILIAIGYSFLFLVNTSHDNETNLSKSKGAESKVKLLDSLSPIQLISQIKGYVYLNSVLTLSLAITLFSFVGVPPLVGFFAKQMVLSAALDNGYIFMTLVGILTSVISAVYYLAIVKELFFEQSEYKQVEKMNNNNIFLSSSLTCTISILTLFILLFMFIPTEFMYLTSIITI